MKIVVVGGSSPSTPALFESLAAVPDLPPLEVVLLGRSAEATGAGARVATARPHVPRGHPRSPGGARRARPGHNRRLRTALDDAPAGRRCAERLPPRHRFRLLRPEPPGLVLPHALRGTEPAGGILS